MSIFPVHFEIELKVFANQLLIVTVHLRVVHTLTDVGWSDRTKNDYLLVVSKTLETVQRTFSNPTFMLVYLILTCLFVSKKNSQEWRVFNFPRGFNFIYILI